MVIRYVIIGFLVFLLAVFLFLGGHCFGGGPGGNPDNKDNRTEMEKHSDVKPPSTPNSKVSEDPQVIVISGEGYKYLIDGLLVGGYKNLEREVEKRSGALFDLSAFMERPQTREKVRKLVERYNGKIVR